MYEITEKTRRFHLDEEVLPGSAVLPKLEINMPFANHGRHIARNSSGIWFCAFINSRNVREQNFLQLSVSQSAEDVGGEFNESVVLAGETGTWMPFFETAGEIGNVCLAVDGADRLHVIYGHSGGIHMSSTDAAGESAFEKLKDRSAWAEPVSLAGEGCSLGDALLLPDGSLAIYMTRKQALVEIIVERGETVISDDGEHPNVFVDASWRRHVAFERDRRVFYSVFDGEGWKDSRGESGAEMVAYFCSSWPSIAMTELGTIVIAYQGEGKVDLRRHPEIYGKMRPGGGSTVSYAVNEGCGWKIHDFLRSSEILLKRRVSSSLPSVGKTGSFNSHLEEFWRPALTIDRHGVIWMFFLNTTRRHIFFTRFGGETFGDHYEARGAYDCPSRNYFVQRDCRKFSSVGFMMSAANQLYFDQLDVPTFSSSEQRRIVFLDNLELDELRGIEHCLGHWQKQPEPLSFEGEFEHPLDRHFAWCDVRKTEDGFLMRYMGQGNLRNNGMPGRASSDDGIQWKLDEPFDMSKLTLNGEPFPSVFWRPVFLEDPDEKDPGRRFKGICGTYRYVDGVEHRTWSVVISADAEAWHTLPELEPVLVGDISVGFHLVRDDHDKNPKRRYKAMLLMGCHAGRGAVIFTSPDLIHWDRTVWLREDPDNVISPVSPYCTGPLPIDPDAAENPWEEEIHDAALWRENGQMMFHYDAFYFHFNQHTQKALAVSRDGRHYWRIKRGEINMPHGNCGEWDSGRDRTCLPVRVGNELWLYYCGMPASYFADPEAPDYLTMKHTAWNKPDFSWELRPWGVGLAKLRVDGWGYLQREREASEGVVTTIPFEYVGGQLVVNGSGLGGVRVEVRNAANTGAVPGFEAPNSAFSESDGLVAKVAWQSGAVLAHGTYRLRFILESVEAKLYAFGFE